MMSEFENYNWAQDGIYSMRLSLCVMLMRGAEAQTMKHRDQCARSRGDN